MTCDLRLRHMVSPGCVAVATGHRWLHTSYHTGNNIASCQGLLPPVVRLV